jgi:hypothetical protein
VTARTTKGARPGVHVAAATRGLRVSTALLVGAARRHRVALAAAWLTLIAVLAWATGAKQLAAERYDDFGPVLDSYQMLPAPALVTFLAISIGISLLFGRARHRAFAIALGAIPIVGAAVSLVIAFALAGEVPASVRWAAAGAVAIVVLAVIVLGARGHVARTKEVLCLAGFALTWSLAPVMVGRAAAGSSVTPLMIDAAVVIVLFATHAFSALVALLFLGEPRTRIPLGVPERHGPRAHLASARTFALVLFVPIYLGFDLAGYVRVGDHVRTVARRGLLKGETAAILQKELAGAPLGPERREIPIQQVIAGVGVLKAKIVCETGRCSGTISIDTHEDVLVEPIDVEPKDLPKTMENARLAMTSDAIYIGAVASRDASLRDLFVAIRDRLEARTVHVPLIDLQLGTSRARWALGVIVVAILVLVRNRLGTALRDGGASDDEPWLLLDTGDPAERVVSAFYYVAVVSASSLVACALALTTRAESTQTASLLLAGLWASTTWLSLSVGDRILALRARRLASHLATPVHSNATRSRSRSRLHRTKGAKKR